MVIVLRLTDKANINSIIGSHSKTMSRGGIWGGLHINVEYFLCNLPLKYLTEINYALGFMITDSYIFSYSPTIFR